MTFAVIAMGSNIAPRRKTLHAGVEALRDLEASHVSSISTLHETDPVDAPDGSQPFLNGAVLLNTALDATALMRALLAIEDAHGRVRAEPNGPRTLDLDLVLFGTQLVDVPGLEVPHPRAHERLFVLEPAAEVAPHMRHPLLGQTLMQLRDALRDGAADTASV